MARWSDRAPAPRRSPRAAVRRPCGRRPQGTCRRWSAAGRRPAPSAPGCRSPRARCRPGPGAQQSQRVGYAPCQLVTAIEDRIRILCRAEQYAGRLPAPPLPPRAVQDVVRRDARPGTRDSSQQPLTRLRAAMAPGAKRWTAQPGPARGKRRWIGRTVPATGHRWRLPGAVGSDCAGRGTSPRRRSDEGPGRAPQCSFTFRSIALQLAREHRGGVRAAARGAVRGI